MSTSDPISSTEPTGPASPVAKRQKTAPAPNSKEAVARSNGFLVSAIRDSPSFCRQFFDDAKKLEFRCVTKTSTQTTKWQVTTNDGHFLVPGRVRSARFAFHGSELDKIITAEDRFGGKNKVELHLSLDKMVDQPVPGVPDFHELVAHSREAMLRAVRMAVRDLIVPLLRKIAEKHAAASKKADKNAVLSSINGIDAGMMKDMLAKIADIADDNEAAKAIMSVRYFIKGCGSNHHCADGPVPDDDFIVRARRTLYDGNLVVGRDAEGLWRNRVFNIMHPGNQPVPMADESAADGNWPGFHQNAINRNDLGLARMTMKVTACGGWIIGFEADEFAQMASGAASSGGGSSLFAMAADTPAYE
jgi:hypothetical protein